MESNLIEISPLQRVVVGGTWRKTLDLIPESGSLTITAVADYFMARDATSNLDSSYVTGSPAFSGGQVTTGEVGTGSIPPNKYTYFLLITTSANVLVLYQNFEFIPMKGL